MKKIRKLLAVLLLAGLLVLLGAAALPEQKSAAETAEFRAVWVASVYNLDYPTKATASITDLKREVDAILQGCVEMGMNAVILQVRPSCDALYPSELFPWSRYLTGQQGTAPSGGFDPLAYWVERAHALGLELHAWVNPYRVTKGGAEEFAALSPNNPAVLHPDWVVVHDGNYYLNPGLPQVRELVIQGAEELVRNYDLDGIHLDDYFYPGSNFDDAAAFAQYGGGYSDLGDWRRDNVNQLVKALGERLHAIDPDLSYGISPSGVWADSKSMPQGSATTGGYESYYASYADSRKWVQEGWIDYICPQIYWYIGHKTMDYKTIVRWWADTVQGTGVSLYIGMADYQAGNTDSTSPWYGTEALKKQLALNDTLPQVVGEVHFRYQLIAANAQLKALYQSAYAPAQPAPAPVPTPTPVPVPVERAYLNTSEHNAYIQGSGGLFRPDAPLSRADAVTLLARLSVNERGKDLYTGEERFEGFSDVNSGAWYASYISFARTYGVASGYSDGTFRPDASVSRAELVKMLSTYFDLPGEAVETGFPDVPANHWAAGAVVYAVEAGWVSGYPDGTFRPEQPVSRAEAVKLINRALGRSLDPDCPAEVPFDDVAENYWAYSEILEAAVSHTYARTEDGEIWIQYE